MDCRTIVSPTPSSSRALGTPDLRDAEHQRDTAPLGQQSGSHEMCRRGGDYGVHPEVRCPCGYSSTRTRHCRRPSGVCPIRTKRDDAITSAAPHPARRATPRPNALVPPPLRLRAALAARAPPATPPRVFPHARLPPLRASSSRRLCGRRALPPPLGRAGTPRAPDRSKDERCVWWWACAAGSGVSIPPLETAGACAK